MIKTGKTTSQIISEATLSPKFVPICLLIAFLLRIFWIIFVNNQPIGDFEKYYLEGMAIASGEGFSLHGKLTALTPIGYPGFLGLLFAVFGKSVFVAKVANVVLYMGSLLFIYQLTKKLFSSEFTARITLLVLSVYPNHIAYSSLLSYEILFLFLLMLSILFLMIEEADWRLITTTGVLFGVTCLVKPQAFFVPAICFGVFYKTRRKKSKLLKQLWQLGVVYLLIILAMVPWVIRNYYVFNDFVLGTTHDGYILYIGNNPWANGTYNDEWKFNNEVADYIFTAGNESARNKRAKTLAIEYITKHPMQMIKRIPKKLWYLYGKDIEGFYVVKDGLKSETLKKSLFPLQVIAQLCYIALIVFFLFSLYFFSRKLKGRNDKKVSTLGMWIIVYFTLVYLVFFGDSRYHFPIIPWMVMYVAALLEIKLQPKTQLIP